jgi:uncharacterized integral membrane protein
MPRREVPGTYTPHPGPRKPLTIRVFAARSAGRGGTRDHPLAGTLGSTKSDDRREVGAMTDERAKSSGERRSAFRLVVAGLIVVAVLAFLLQNQGTVRFEWMTFGIEMPLWGLALVFFALGIALGWLLHVRRARAKSVKA